MEQDTTSWPEVILAVTFGFGVLVLGTILIVVVIRTLAANTQAKAAAARDDAFRMLAESYDALLQRTTVAQQANTEQLAQIRTRVESMEHLMRTVE